MSQLSSSLSRSDNMSSRLVKLPKIKRALQPQSHSKPTSLSRASPVSRRSPSPYAAALRPPRSQRATSNLRKPPKPRLNKGKSQPCAQIQSRIFRPSKTDSVSTSASSFAFPDIYSHRPSVRYEGTDHPVHVGKSLTFTPSEASPPSSLLQTRFRTTKSQQEPFNMNSPSSKADLRPTLEKIESTELLSGVESEMSSVGPPEATVTPACIHNQPLSDPFEQIFGVGEGQKSTSVFDLDAPRQSRHLPSLRKKVSITPTPTLSRLDASHTPRRGRSHPRPGHTALFSL